MLSVFYYKRAFGDNFIFFYLNNYELNVYYLETVLDYPVTVTYSQRL